MLSTDISKYIRYLSIFTSSIWGKFMSLKKSLVI